MRTSALLAAGLILLTLTGCVPVDPPVVPQPEPSSTPLFASEEEALAAAEEAYAAYLAISDQITSEGGASPERADQYLTESMQIEAAEGNARFVEKGWHTQGHTTFDSMSVQQFDGESLTSVLVTYACIDVAGIRIVDSSGADVTPATRRERVPVELEFLAEASTAFKLERSELWSGDDFCS